LKKLKLEIVMLKIKTLALLLLISVSCIQASKAPGGPETQKSYYDQQQDNALWAKGSADRGACDQLCASVGLTRKAIIFDMEQTHAGYSARGGRERGFIKQCVCE
jgi:hypothetical protein